MSGAIPPLPQYASMAWCSVKAQGKLYFSRNSSGFCGGGQGLSWAVEPRKEEEEEEKSGNTLQKVPFTKNSAWIMYDQMTNHCDLNNGREKQS
jgi:nitroimidazol reductase NimA-like FMN-containing flavoprotein (pyridoxamine 5'-phosphate oxidase superfamily)